MNSEYNGLEDKISSNLANKFKRGFDSMSTTPLLDSPTPAPTPTHTLTPTRIDAEYNKLKKLDSKLSDAKVLEDKIKTIMDEIEGATTTIEDITYICLKPIRKLTNRCKSLSK